MFFLIVFGCTIATETDIDFNSRKDRPKNESVQNDELYASLQELINSQCINCHGLGAEASGLDLTNNFCESVVNINSEQYVESLLVKPGSLEKSVFWHKITSTGEYGQGMPTMDGLSESERSLFEDWIVSGANCIEENNSDTVFLGTCAEEDLSSESLVDLSQLEGYESCYECEGEGRDVSCSSLFQYEDFYICEGFRLPSEAEWEYASRSGSTSAIWTPSGGAEIPSGVEFSCEEEQFLTDGTAISDFAWYCGTTSRAQSVGQLNPNGYGLYDMSGNVWEWSHDGFGNYPEVPTYNPLGGAGDVHALRGGRWGNEPYALRAAKRISVAPDFWDGNFGFRLAISARSLQR